MTVTEQRMLIGRLLSEEEDPDLDYALDRLRKNFYQLYQPVREYQEDPSRLEEWQQARRHSVEWRKRILFLEGLEVLDAALYG